MAGACALLSQVTCRLWVNFIFESERGCGRWDVGWGYRADVSVSRAELACWVGPFIFCLVPKDETWPHV